MTCCGRPMTTEGGRYVCGTCGAWFDAGVQLAGGAR
jgi:hypothetical protein